MRIDSIEMLILVGRLVFFALLIIAGISKLNDTMGFRDIVESYALLPPRLVRGVAKLLPIVEIIVAFVVLIPGTSAIGFAVSGGLLCLYLVALGSVKYRNISLRDCGCGGALWHQELNAWPFVRNAVLIIAAVMCMSASRGEIGATFAEWSVALPFAAFLLLTYWVADGLNANITMLRIVRGHE